MMFRFPSVICTRCTGFFCLAIIKGPPNDIYCIIEEPYKHYFTEKVSYSLIFRLATLAYHRRILFTDFFSQSLKSGLLFVKVLVFYRLLYRTCFTHLFF